MATAPKFRIDVDIHNLINGQFKATGETAGAERTSAS
jgi:hypothetical protein